MQRIARRHAAEAEDKKHLYGKGVSATLHEYDIEMIAYVPVLLLLVGMSLTVLVDSYISKKHRRIMLIIIALIFSLVVQDFLSFLLQVMIINPFARTLVGIFGYSVRPIILILFFYIVGTRHSYRPFWMLAVVNLLVYMTALFCGVAFAIDTNNHFQRGPLGYCCHIVSALLLIYLVYLSIKKYNRDRKKEALIPILNALLIVVSVAADSIAGHRDYPITFLTISVVISSLFYYIWLHLQLVRRHEQALQAEQRIQIMMTQIKPHFLFNTIATFKALCRKDPDKAAEVADKFGIYLRQNLDSLGQTSLIPFRKELEHTRLYSDIEMVRFDNLRVEYDIGDDDFKLPYLTVQPMVENAIRHGVRIREVGIVRVITRHRSSCHEIMIDDNGVGFDVNALNLSGNRHIGINNVRERVESMCGGSFSIDSRPGIGTSVTIRIPLRGEEK